jgi:hypothetical protein
MTRLTLLVAAAATAAVTMISTAEARDGCGRGLYFDGYRCVPSGAAYHRGGYRAYGSYGSYGYRNPEGSYLAPNFRGNTVRPTRGRDGAISCSNRNYTWQDGACKPYRGG